MNSGLQKLLIILVTIFFVSGVSAQTFQGTGGIIPSEGSPVEFKIEVSGLPETIDPSFGIETFCFNAYHSWMADIHIELISPSGTKTILVDNIGGDQDSFKNTCLNNKATYSIFEGGYPFTGTYKPLGQLGNNNNGQNPNGIWTLKAYDVYPFVDDGGIIDWSITFGNNPSVPFVWTSSRLPIIKFYPENKSIGDEPAVIVKMQVIDNGPGNDNHLNDPPNNYNGFANIEWRGQSSLSFPKKSYRVETCDSMGVDSSVSIAGLPKESDWVLHASFSDKTLMRNVLSNYIFNAMGHYSSRTRFVDVFVNDDYYGLYVLEEKVKRDKNRVDVAKLKATDIDSSAVTGGYIFKADKGDDGGWHSKQESIVQGTNTYYQYVYPKKDSIQPEQAAYIEGFVDSLEEALFSPGFTNAAGYHYEHYLDLPSFVDNFIINEISKNIDAYRLSTYFHKQHIKDGGKLFAGPLWDFDLSFRNAGFCTGENPVGWIYDQYCDYNYFPPPMFFYKMFEDSSFWNAVKCRWEVLRKNILSEVSLNDYIDGQRESIYEEQKKNFELWPILGAYIWPNPGPIAKTYDEEILQMKNWIFQRMGWIDKNLPGSNVDCNVTSVNESGKLLNLKVYPNPAKNQLNIKWSDAKTTMVDLNIINTLGQSVFSTSGLLNNSAINIENIPSGSYLIKVISEGKILNVEKIYIIQ